MNNPKPILGFPNLETDSGSPRSDMGIVFFVFFFQSRTRSAFSHQKLRQSGLRCAAAATATAATTAATAAATAGRHASSAATASNLSSSRLLFSPHPPPSRLLVSSLITPDPDDDDDDDNDDDTVSAASTATTTASRVCRLWDWASRCPSINLPSSSSSLMSSLTSQLRLQTPPHRCCRDCQRPPMGAHIPVAQSWQERLSSSSSLSLSAVECR